MGGIDIVVQQKSPVVGQVEEAHARSQPGPQKVAKGLSRAHGIQGLLHAVGGRQYQRDWDLIRPGEVQNSIEVIDLDGQSLAAAAQPGQRLGDGCARPESAPPGEYHLAIFSQVRPGFFWGSPADCLDERRERAADNPAPTIIEVLVSGPEILPRVAFVLEIICQEISTQIGPVQVIPGGGELRELKIVDTQNEPTGQQVLLL
ncbi:hypothetical protein IV102_15840 [bacterium]|nr:hypothetical protein [bacterium]